MDILFINPTEEAGLRKENNGTLLLATVLLQNHFEAEVLRFYQFENYDRDYRAFIEEISDAAVARKPKCVSFYTMWPYFHVNLGIARRIKELSPDMPIVMGGPLTSLYPREVLERIPWVDYVCAGEGENTIVPFVQAMLDGYGYETIPGLWYRSEEKVVNTGIPVPVSDLNGLPQWDDRLLPADPRQEEKIGSATYYMPIDVGRGCPFNCTFCCSNRVWKRKYRLKTPEKIVEEIKYHYEKFGIRSFLFAHDAFTVNNRLVSEVCDRINESGMDITWDCTTRVNCVNKELLEKMINSGMRQIQMGVETGSTRMQQVINKKLDLEHLREMVTFLRERKIGVMLFFMFGFPEETEADIKETLNLFLDYLEMGVGYMSMSLCKFNPGTELTDRYFDQLVYPTDPKQISTEFFGYMEEEELIKQHKELFPFFYNLNTPLRDQYWYLKKWARMCRMASKATPFVRQMYKDDVLSFYRDFVRNNADFLEKKPGQAKRRLGPMEQLINTVSDAVHPKADQLRALLEFMKDADEIRSSQTDAKLQKTYDFCYLDFMRKLPLDSYSQGKSELLIVKTNGKTSVKVINMQ